MHRKPLGFSPLDFASKERTSGLKPSGLKLKIAINTPSTLSTVDQPILIISGTFRPQSNTLIVSRVLLDHYARAGVNAELFSVADLPPEAFLPTVYTHKPPAVQALQQRVLSAVGLHVLTPEYNGSFPGILKHFIDLLKFPESFEHKPIAFVGLANGMFGALRAVEHLQAVFGYRNAHMYPDRVFIPGVKDKMNADGKFIDPAIDERLARQAAGFAKYAAGFPRP